jgi:hypothetical protein
MLLFSGVDPCCSFQSGMASIIRLFVGLFALSIRERRDFALYADYIPIDVLMDEGNFRREVRS